MTAVAAAIEAVNAWVAAGRPARNWAGSNMPAAIRAIAAAHAAAMPTYYWRGTNRKSEAADVRRGVAIISRNHADGTAEAGMSVSRTLATVWAYGYRYAYKVTGETVGGGSDGEPVLVNAKPVGKVMTAAEAIAADETRVAIIRINAEIATATGLTAEQVAWLAAQ